jgi:hypothetical protein
VLLGCVRRAQKDEDPSIALIWLERLKKEFPSAPEAKGTAELTTRLWVQTGRYFHSDGAIEPWEPDPSVRERSDRVRLEIYNDSRDPPTLRLSGPQATEVPFAACRSCRAFRDSASARCVRKGPFRTVLLEPGTYELVTGQDKNRLKYGRMTLRAHSVYRRCFYSLD